MKLGIFLANKLMLSRNVASSSNSNLQTIEEDAFSNSTIKSIFIPPKESKICENAFFFAKIFR